MTKYDSKYHPKELIKLMTKGFKDCQIYAKWGIHKDTFYTWIKEHEEFKEAHEIGMPLCQSWWEDFGIKLMNGEVKGKHSFAAWAFFMNHKFGWTPKREFSDSTTTIQINQLNVLQHKNKDELIEFITKGLEDVKEVEYRLIESTQDEQTGVIEVSGSSEDSEGQTKI